MDKTSFVGQITAILIEHDVLTQNVLQEAIEQAQAEEKPLENYLVEKKIVTDLDMTLALADYLGIPPISLAHFMPDNELLELIPKEKRVSLQVIPIARVGKLLTVAMGDPFNIAAVDELESLTEMTIVPLVVAEREIKELMDKFSEQDSVDLEDVFKDLASDEEIQVDHDSKEDVDIEQVLESAEGAPVVRIVNSLLVEALRRRASDIHIEPMEKLLRLRYRIDGDLYEVPSPPKSLQAAIISRIKIMSDMNIAERRIPQDGRFKIKALRKEVDVRVNLLPCVHGEKIVMRLLDKANLPSGVADLGLDQKAYESLVTAISQPHGIILVTGPTGCGKTTTLYSCLQDLNKTDVNIVTTEDPVEYQLPGINQVQIYEEVGLTFANALRSILRQDPDIILVGEIRDPETASIAIKAALTGHLVLSTLHTNDAAGAITRLLDMGSEPFLLASSLIMTQAQRLYKKLCAACRKPCEIPVEILRLNNVDPKYFEGIQLYEPGGCPKCSGSGFKGRSSIMEVLMMDDTIRPLILEHVNAKALTDQAVANGMLTLKMVGLEKAKQGISSLEEILSVTGAE